MNIEHDAINVVILIKSIIYIILIISWIKTFFEIVYLEKIKIIKLALIVLILFVPVLPVLYQMRVIIKKSIGSSFKLMWLYLKDVGQSGFSLIRWMSSK